MIPSLTSLVPSDRRDPELLLVQPYFAPLRLSVSGEKYSHTGTLRLVVLVVLVPCGRLERMGECTLVDIQALPFFSLFELSHSGDLGLMSVPYLLSRFLLIPSSPTSVPVTLDFLSLIVQSGHHFLSHSLSLEPGVVLVRNFELFFLLPECLLCLRHYDY